MANYIAVYGTLKKGYRNHDLLLTSKFIKNSHTGSGFALFVDDLPFLVQREDGKGAEIEIYEVSNEILQDLDRLEGHPKFYTRIFLRYEDDKKLEIYVLNKDLAKQLIKQPISKATESY